MNDRYSYLAHIDEILESKIVDLRKKGKIGQGKTNSLNFHINAALKEYLPKLEEK